MLRNAALQVSIEPSRLVWRTETMSSGLHLINNASLKHKRRVREVNLCSQFKSGIPHLYTKLLFHLLMPAALTRNPTGPQVLAMVSNALCTSCSLETSQPRPTCSTAVKIKRYHVSWIFVFGKLHAGISKYIGFKRSTSRQRVGCGPCCFLVPGDHHNSMPSLRQQLGYCSANATRAAKHHAQSGHRPSTWGNKRDPV